METVNIERLSDRQKRDVLLLVDKLPEHDLPSIEKKARGYLEFGKQNEARTLGNEYISKSGVQFRCYDGEWDLGPISSGKYLDSQGIPYDDSAVKERFSECWIPEGVDSPSVRNIRGLESVLQDAGLGNEERTSLFEKSVDKIGKSHYSGGYSFFQNVVAGFVRGERKETVYSVLAGLAGKSREEVVAHYLDILLSPLNHSALKFSELDSEPSSDYVAQYDSSSSCVNIFCDFVKREGISPADVGDKIFSMRDSLGAQRNFHYMNAFAKHLSFPQKLAFRVFEDYMKTDSFCESFPPFEKHWTGKESGIVGEPLVRQISDEEAVLSVCRESFKRISAESKYFPLRMTEQIVFSVESLGAKLDEGWLKEGIVRGLEDLLNGGDMSGVESGLEHIGELLSLEEKYGAVLSYVENYRKKMVDRLPVSRFMDNL